MKVSAECVQVIAMVFADDIRRIILKIASERGPGKSFKPSDVAQVVDQHNWKYLIDQVSLVATILEREGKIKTTQSAGQLNLMQIDSRLSK